MQAIIITDGTVEEIAALILAVQEQHEGIDIETVIRQCQEGMEEALAKNSGKEKTVNAFVNPAQEVEDLGLEDEESGMLGQWTADLIGKMHLNKITIKQLAAEVGWHPGYLSTVLNGYVNPKNAEKKLKEALEKLIAQRMENC